METIKHLGFTDKQKDHLLEMTRTLFPITGEYDQIHMHVNAGEYWRDDEYIGFNLYFEGIYQEIHWYEFCIRYLCKAIFNSLEDEEDDYPLNWLIDHHSIGVGLEDLQYQAVTSKKHIIDYLYDEFKEIQRRNEAYKVQEDK